MEPVAQQQENPEPEGFQMTTKDLSLISLVPKWAGTGRLCSLNEFFESVQSAASLGNWSDRDKVRIASLKLTETARLFFNTTPELH
jgi:hypothetical protein